MRLPIPHRFRDRHRSRGQSIVEFALVLPLILLLTMIALDFGRVYLGYVNLQNMARIAANFAANNPTAWTGAGNAPLQTQYRNQILNEARATNCALPQVAGAPAVPTPTFADTGGNASSTDLGDTATVQMTCTFRIVTPIISSIVGTNGDLAVSASAVFPIKKGLVGTGGSAGNPPTAAFTASPTAGVTPLTVQFTDTSTGSPTSWAWDFNDDGLIDVNDQQHPQWTFTVGLHTITLIATNDFGPATLKKTNYISVGTTPAEVSFTADPTSGAQPLVVQFEDTSSGNPTSWEWDFNNDGTVDSTEQMPSYTYTTAGTYSVRLTVTNDTGPASLTIVNFINVQVGTCVVPDLVGRMSNTAQGVWSGAGFTTTVQFQQGNLPWIIDSQNRVVGQNLPCNTAITVSKN